ncbi:stalk domain-containing protein [Paenibacillus sp. sgz5001063]|uniref:stalk domain-containing protein n=1 Tax=Paenibacillus sp. sgz5001063 TaxID=3242474 RepID=UPI0036D3D020
MKRWIITLSLALSLTASLSVSSAFAEAAQDTSTASSIASYGADYLIKTDGSLWVWGDSRSVPTEVPGIENVQSSFNMPLDGLFAVSRDQTVWKVETSASTLAMQSTPLEQMKNLSDYITLGDRTIAVTGDGSIFSSTHTYENNRMNSTAFTLESGIDQVAQIAGYFEDNKDGHWTRYLFLKKDGTVWSSYDNLATFQQIPGLNDVIQLQNNYALRKDKTVWTWPVQSLYEPDTMGDPAILKPVPLFGLANINSIRYSGHALLGIDSKAQLWFWGQTVTGVSDSTTYHNQAAPVLFSGIQNVTDAYMVERSIVALTSEHKVYTASVEEQLLSANAEFGLLASDIESIKGGGRYVIMQKTDGTLWGWGVNKNAQFGNGEYEFNYHKPMPMQKPISVSLNGERVNLTNGVITRSSQNFVPLRSLFDKLGAKVDYQENVQALPATKPGATNYKVDKMVIITRNTADKPALSITINTVTGATSVNNKSVTLPTPPFIVNGTVYLPLRFISEQLGAVVNWLPQEETIEITMK